MTGPTRRTLALALSGWVTVTLAALPAPVPLRVIAVFGFVGLCPGLVWVRLLRRSDPLEQVVLSVALSLSLAALVAETMAILHWWSTLAGLAVLAAVTNAGALIGLDIGRRRGPEIGAAEGQS